MSMALQARLPLLQPGVLLAQNGARPCRHAPAGARSQALRDQVRRSAQGRAEAARPEAGTHLIGGPVASHGSRLLGVGKGSVEGSGPALGPLQVQVSLLLAAAHAVLAAALDPVLKLQAYALGRACEPIVAATWSAAWPPRGAPHARNAPSACLLACLKLYQHCPECCAASVLEALSLLLNSCQLEQRAATEAPARSLGSASNEPAEIGR